MSNKYAFLMINYDTPNFIKNIHNKIEEDDLYDNKEDYGIEDETHVTVVPCLDNDVKIEDLKKLLLPLENYEIKINGISLFENNDFDALKCDVICNNLFQTNKDILKKYKSHSEYKEYHPHLTIAKLKKDCAKKYIYDLEDELQIKPKSFHWSYYDKDNNCCELFFK